jgi:hypothetical protein
MKMQSASLLSLRGIRYLLNLLGAFLLGATLVHAEPYLVVSGDVRGEIKPCGCAEEGDMGGLQRRGTALSTWRAEHSNLLYLDLGNNFPEPSAQGRLKLNLIQQALNLLKPAAILPGPHEWDYGQATWDTSLPYLLSNAVDLPWPTVISQNIYEERWEIWGYVTPNLLYQNENDLPNVVPVSDLLIRQWQSQSQSDAKRLLLFRGTPAEADMFLQSGWFDRILVGSTNDDELNQVTTFATSRKILQMIPTKGQGLYHGFSSSNQLDVRWLRPDTADWEPLKPLFTNYNQKVKQLFLSALKRRQQLQQESRFVGAAACTTCHIQAHQSWKASQHSRALATLARVGKDFDPECLQCHVVGFQQKGFLSNQLTPQLANVQCENCHGSAQEHIKNPLNHPPLDAQRACVNCHVGSHSPSFKFSTYWPKIQHK